MKEKEQEIKHNKKNKEEGDVLFFVRIVFS